RVMLAGAVEDAVEDVRGAQRAGGVVHQHVLGAGHGGQAGADGVAAMVAALDQAQVGDAGGGGVLLQRIPALRRCDDADGVDAARGGDGAQGQGDQRAAADVEPELVGTHAQAPAVGGDDGGDAQRLPTRVARVPGRGRVAVRGGGGGASSGDPTMAKIIRPAGVCRTLVTVTATVLSMWRRPFSTTTMVPSSR